MAMNRDLREQLNCLTCIEVNFSGVSAADLSGICQRNISEGADETFEVGVRFLALTPSRGKDKAKLAPMNIPKAKVVLEPVQFGRAGEVKGHVSVFAVIKDLRWDSSAKVKPVDVLPHAIASLPSFDFDKVNAFDGSALGEGTAICILCDMNRLGTSEPIGYVDMTSAGAKYLTAEAAMLFRLYVPKSSGLRSENGGFFPYFGDLEEAKEIEVDLMAMLSSMDESLIKQALEVCSSDQKAHGKYTTSINTALQQNAKYQAMQQADQPDDPKNS